MHKKVMVYTCPRVVFYWHTRSLRWSFGLLVFRQGNTKVVMVSEKKKVVQDSEFDDKFDDNLLKERERRSKVGKDI